jgi:hypothetical protein
MLYVVQLVLLIISPRLGAVGWSGSKLTIKSHGARLCAQLRKGHATMSRIAVYTRILRFPIRIRFFSSTHHDPQRAP